MHDFPTTPVQPNQRQWSYNRPVAPMTPPPLPPRKPKHNSCLYSILGAGGCLLILTCIFVSVLVGSNVLSFLTQSPTVRFENIQPYDETSGLGTKPSSRTYKVMGKPTITAAYIDTVLSRNNSPAQGKGNALYKYGVQYGIDPAYALAFFWHESHFGQLGVAQTTLSLGNIRSQEGKPEYNGYRRYTSWEEGFKDWYRLIALTYVDQWGLTTVDKIIPVYAPQEDNNDESAYILTVKLFVDKWRTEIKQQ